MGAGGPPAPKRRGLKRGQHGRQHASRRRECSRPETKGIETQSTQSKSKETYKGSAPAPKRRGLKQPMSPPATNASSGGSAPAPKRRGLKLGPTASPSRA